MNLNLSGTFNVLRLLVKPSLCLPHATVSTFDDLPIPLNKAFAKNGKQPDIRAVVLDKDDCFAIPHHNEVHEPYKKQQFEALRAAYPGRRLLIVSNTAGATSYDVNGRLASEVEKSTGVTVLSHDVKKPGCGEEIMSYFRQHPETGVTSPHQIAVVGDRLTTDMMLANMMGSWGIWIKDGIVPVKQKSIITMGGKIWSREEEEYFWLHLIPHSPKRLGDDLYINEEKDWTWVGEMMTTYMGARARRKYTQLCVFEHYFLNAVLSRFSPKVGTLCVPYWRHEQAMIRLKKKQEAGKAAAEQGLAEQTAAEEANVKDDISGLVDAHLVDGQDVHTATNSLGGTTPTLSELSALLSSLATSDNRRPRPAIRIMIRPRGPPGLSATSTTPTAAPSAPSAPAAAAAATEDDGGSSSSSGGGVGEHWPPDQDFLYTPAELAAMADSIHEFAASGLLSPRHGDGFVFGVLRFDGNDGRRRRQRRRLELDVERNRELVRLVKEIGSKESGIDGEGEGEGPSSPRLACVLHRAVDDLLSSYSSSGEGDGDIEQVMQNVKECGFDGVLTSGGRGSALGNLEGLRAVIISSAAAAATTTTTEAQGLEIIVGGGVRRANLDALVDGLKRGIGDNEVLGERVWFHSSCLGADGKLDEQEVRGLAEQLRLSDLVLTEQ
ncbi:hypothetical protein VTH82DRAFT_5108 [Thermothelomyces myriococcoides]